MRMAFTSGGCAFFDGTALLDASVIVVEDGLVTDIAETVPRGSTEVRLGNGYLAPGLIDLQVNGGAGRMVDRHTDAATLALICATHARLGATGILPTLITDTPEATDHVIAAGIAAIGTPGFLGLHLEGPHLDPRRKGAHDPALIRPMDEADLQRLLRAAEALPALMVTVAPESVTDAQISALSKAGVVVSLGHSDCTANKAHRAFLAGAGAVTHLFNAMSQIGNREPGLVGAALLSTALSGLIADGVHVAPEVIRIAMAANPNGIFLVSDSMAVAGTDLTEFDLGGRKILRRDGRLTLENGTLAGADLTLPQALWMMVDQIGFDPVRALPMATSIPARVIKRPDLGVIRIGAPADLVHLGADMALRSVWQGGHKRL